MVVGVSRQPLCQIDMAAVEKLAARTYSDEKRRVAVLGDADDCMFPSRFRHLSLPKIGHVHLSGWAGGSRKCTK